MVKYQHNGAAKENTTLAIPVFNPGGCAGGDEHVTQRGLSLLVVFGEDSGSLSMSSTLWIAKQHWQG